MKRTQKTEWYLVVWHGAEEVSRIRCLDENEARFYAGQIERHPASPEVRASVEKGE